MMKIKGLILTLFLWSITMLPLTAQLTVGGFLDFNIAGINVKPDISTEDYTSYLGFGLGGVLTYPLMNGLAVQVEPVLLQKGGKVTEFDETLALKILYFEIPVFIRYNIALSKESILPYVILGPNLGFRASSKVVFPDGSSTKNNDEISGFDLGVGLGGGVEVPYDNLIFFGETRYVFGLVDINQEPGESKVMNRGLQILLGVKVPLEHP
jgi:hypothetical protein